MYITQCYKYEINGIIYIGGTPAEEATILETMNILNAKEGFELIRKSDNENVGVNIWLKDNDSQDNYLEIKIEESN